MKREVIENAINNISDQYKDEALAYHSKAEVSEINGMSSKKTKRILTTGIAVAMVVAVGATATAFAAGVFKIKTRDPEPQETLVAHMNSYDEDTDEWSVEETKYTDIEKIIEVEEGGTQAEEIEIRLNHSFDGYDFSVTGDPTDWKNLLQGESSEGFFNVAIYYMPLFSNDGCLFMLDDILSEDTFIGDDGFQHYKVAAANEVGLVSYYHFVFDEQAGHVIVSMSSISEEFTDSLLADLEIRPTGNLVEFDESEDHIYLVVNGLG